MLNPKNKLIMLIFSIFVFIVILFFDSVKESFHI